MKHTQRYAYDISKYGHYQMRSFTKYRDLFTKYSVLEPWDVREPREWQAARVESVRGTCRGDPLRHLQHLRHLLPQPREA